ncbi:hypothetical protein PVAP13_9NG729600 [Panicum virgatum]|uniref:Uncharacterized protein n=1 Tax=Panicum virgatum TaxID=38727 RepID=A0A8T0N7T7_PANVG|nr:hypothetical protein PVAP13_9NG729600 [Panicum virgatum]
MRGDHLFISTQPIEPFEGINVNLRSQSAVHKREGKARAATAPVRSFHTSPPELGRWRAARRFLPSAALLSPPPPHAARLRPGRDPGQAIRSHLHAHLGFPVRAVLGGEGVRGGGLELTARGVSSDTCCGALVSSLRARQPFLQQGFAPFRSG